MRCGVLEFEELWGKGLWRLPARRTWLLAFSLPALVVVLVVVLLAVAEERHGLRLRGQLGGGLAGVGGVADRQLPRPLAHQISSDLAHWNATGITLQHVEQAYCGCRTQGFRFQVSTQRL